MFSRHETSAVLFNHWIELMGGVEFADPQLMQDLLSRIDHDAEYMSGEVKYKLTDLLRTVYRNANPDKEP